MEIYERFVSKIREKNMSPAKFSREIGMSKQLFFYHLKNLKKKKITFNTEQFTKICEKLSVDANFFTNKVYFKVNDKQNPKRKERRCEKWIIKFKKLN